MACDLFVSGRLCLFGEHSDWAGEFSNSNPAILPGRTLVVGTQEGVYARARPLEEKARPRAAALARQQPAADPQPPWHAGAAYHDHRQQRPRARP
jgi:hypothetical protein